MSLRINKASAFAERPEVVLFDADNTLYDADHAHKLAMQAVTAKACKLLGIAPQVLGVAYREARDDVKQRLGNTASSHSRLLYFQSLIEQVGMKTQPVMALDLEQTYWRAFLNASTLFPDAHDFIRDLRSAGIRTAVVTDLTAQIQFRKLIYFGLDEYFDYVVTSEEAGADKPARAPFEIALNKLVCEAEAAWMIGDNPEADIKGAARFGIVTIHKTVEGGRPCDFADGSFDRYCHLRSYLAERGWVMQEGELQVA